MSEPTTTDRAEARAIRRRWVTLAEIVAVAGLLISAAGLWLSWTDRRNDEQEKRIEKTSEAHARALIRLTATPEHDGKQLALKDPEHDVQSVDLRFPKALGIGAQNSILTPHVEAEWIAAPLLAATKHGPDKRQGRLPVLVSSSYWDGDQQRTDTAIYDLVWQTEGGAAFGILGGRSVKLKGMMLRERSASASRLDALWAAEKPRESE